VWDTAAPMARRRTTPSELPDAVRDAVERTMQATVGSAERTRDAVDELVKGAESRGRAVRDVVGGALPATQEDIRELRTELRRISRRLEAIEERLPAPKRSG
jgi:polyhydroxyalkanoate synthesis regulator phasin